MNNNFDLIYNLALIFFAVCFFIDFILFIWAGISLLKAKENALKVEKGRKLLSNAFIFLFIIVLILVVFYLISFLLKRGEVFIPSGDSGEFPVASHLGVFPNEPEFIKIGNYYFTGPWLFKDSQNIRKSAIYAVLCKKGEEYDILYINETSIEKLMKHRQYTCWLENCEKNVKNLYVAIFWTPLENYDTIKRKAILNELNNQINPPCFEDTLKENL